MRTALRSSPVGLSAILAALAIAACGKDDKPTAQAQGPGGQTQTTRVEVVKGLGSNGGFDPSEIYKRESPGVVTVISEFSGGRRGVLEGEPGGGDRGPGSGVVVAGGGEIAPNAHVVSEGEGRRLRKASNVYVQFPDDNQVPARIVGVDPNSDVALLKVDPRGLTLRPLPLGSSSKLEVGAPVAAIGSPFGEPESLSVGVISALDRTIDSLTNFQISGAIQTDAAINRGNSGGPLVDAQGRVLGINSQIRSTSGTGSGVGFAVPVDTVKRSLEELRRRGSVPYAYVGVSSVALFPQLAKRFGLPVQRGVYVQEVVDGAPADKAGIKAGDHTERF